MRKLFDDALVIRLVLDEGFSADCMASYNWSAKKFSGSASFSISSGRITGPNAIKASNSLPTALVCGSELMARPPLSRP